MKHSKLFWYKLDNAAKIYPILTTDRYTYVFRVSAILKETINIEVLYQAITEAKVRFPSFFVRIKRGLFWYYFEENLKDPYLQEESPFVCKKVGEHFNNRYLFQFLYYNNRISREINHVLTDGGGATKFLTAVVYHYLELLGKQMIPDDSVLLIKDKPSESELEDSYSKFYGGGDINPPKLPKAYIYNRKLFRSYGSGIINSFIDTKQFINLVKSNNASMTQYIVALLIYSIIMNGNRKKLRKHPVNVCVPVNLRPIYGSKSLNNFSLVFYVSYQLNSDEADFDDILARVRLDFLKENTKEKVQTNLDTIYSVQKKYFVRLILLPIKWILFKIGYHIFGRKPTTITFSNFGKIQVPKDLESHI
ncbi:MAG: hypothetical protein KAH13_04750, partial [Tenericutes bacterium]|nr:hypothetical protein [Mycoplasmatota bacterium]